MTMATPTSEKILFKLLLKRLLGKVSSKLVAVVFKVLFLAGSYNCHIPELSVEMKLLAPLSRHDFEKSFAKGFYIRNAFVGY